ncbi:MAG: hypothetical protein AVDCRST_MAG01-01-2457 [uncultured Rubrobacteraceae bacterium]|uniref:Uncharacterized protein n=1 Tax=uncultured Rubrobacteraceae bacterium TaxID=349277 RepID=A0A6J4PU16_9ACTN|nr:MAG: hypothetical protein AVDCRST_MAG01-01-2457 [uncultured Rubrobacteraceae bacterium]
MVQVGVGYDGRVYLVDGAEVWRRGTPPVRLDAGVHQHPRRPEVEQVAAAAHLTRPSERAERERGPLPGVAAIGRTVLGRSYLVRRYQILYRHGRGGVRVFGLLLGGFGGVLARGAHIGLGLQYLAHELEQVRGPGRGVERGRHGSYLVLYRPHQQLAEAVVGKAGVLERVLYAVALCGHEPELFVELVHALGGPGVGGPLAFERPLQLLAAPLELGDALVEAAPGVQGRGGLLLGLSHQVGGPAALAGEDVHLFRKGGGPLVGGPRGEGEPLVLALQALELRLKVPDVGVLGGLLLRRALLRAPGLRQRLDDGGVLLLVGRQRRQEETFGGVGLRHLFQVLPGEVFEGVEGLRRDLLLHGRPEGAPCRRVLADPARHAAQEGGPPAGLTRERVGPDAPGQQHLVEPRHALAEFRERPPGVEPAEAAHHQLLRQAVRRSPV